MGILHIIKYNRLKKSLNVIVFPIQITRVNIRHFAFSNYTYDIFFFFFFDPKVEVSYQFDIAKHFKNSKRVFFVVQ